jgi:hypothetical protein
LPYKAKGKIMTTKTILDEAKNYARYDPQFCTKAGWLKPYALSCGYCQFIENNEHGKHAKLEGNSNQTYSVYTNIENKWQGWTSYDTLMDARKVFLILARIIVDYK